MLEIKLLYPLFILVLLFNYSFAQEPDIQKVISDIEKGEIDKAKILLVSLEKDNPNSVSVKFLKAILNENGDEAAKLYKDVVFSSEESELKDDALFKLYQYHYSRSEFNESDKYTRMLKEYFPQSEYVNYLKREIISTPRLEVQQKFEQKILADKIQSTPSDVTPNLQQRKLFSIQVGAFSTEANAKRLVNQLIGYKTTIREKNLSGKNFYVVLVGEFDSESLAKSEVQTIKNKFGLDGFVVPLNQ
jgi:hypothetical protein